jgi:hypothetical protein
MSGNEKFLSDIRNAVGALTEADPYFIDIPVITERLKDLQGRIDKIVGTAGGIALILVTPVVTGALANVRGANFTGIKVLGRVLENTNRNQTGKEALDIAIYTAALWSQAKPDQLSAALRPDEPVISLGNDPKFLSYDISFLTEGGTAIQVPQLAPVTIDPSDLSAVALAQVTPGAAIFYTLDGSAPIPRNPAASLFLAPFMTTSGTTLRARAWLAGYLPSAELKQTL